MEQYVFSFLVAILIFSLGGSYSLYEGIHKILHPSEKLEHADINLIILAIAIALEGYSSFIATKELKKTKGGTSFFKYIRKTKDQVLVTVIFEDYAALLGLVIAGLGMTMYLITGNVIYDSIATILIGVLLVAIAVILYREAKSLLVGEAASMEDQTKIRAAFEANPNVERLDELLTMHLSATQILVNAHVKFKGGLTLEEVEDIIDEIEDVIIADVPEVFKIFIETHQKITVEELRNKRPQPVVEEKKKRSVIRNTKSTNETP
jgi:cation diffusion facilitator family transporter